MKKKNKKIALRPKTVRKLVKDWQKCRPEILPGLFYAYDEKEEQSERVVTYRLPEAALAELLDSISDPDDFHFVVHLGMRKKYDTDAIPDQPAFVLMIQARTGDNTGGKKGCYELQWDPNSRFSYTMAEDSASKANALSAAGAYLFVFSWMELAETELGEPFTAVSKVLGKRVQRYVFSKIESHSILKDLQASEEISLDIHLGNGLAVWEHPFSFRPVIEVRGANISAGQSQVARNASGPLNDDGDSFYDFGDPEPPPYEGD